MNIKDMVKDGKKVKLMHYQNEELWYVTECGFEFPVPIEDTQDGKFLPEDKAIYFMRYIKPQIAYIEASKEEQAD